MNSFEIDFAFSFQTVLSSNSLQNKNRPAWIEWELKKYCEVCNCLWRNLFKKKW